MQERKSTFSLLFFIKRKKLLKNGDAPVYMRVTVDGRFLEAALKRGIKPKLWNEKKQRSNGRDRLLEKARVFDPFGHARLTPSGKIRLTP